MDVYDISNITDIKEDVVKKWTVRQRIKASKYKTLYKILECEMSVLGAKLPFLEENQIKCIALNWMGIPTIMGQIPNAQTIGYLIPAKDKNKVMTMIQLLFSKRKASKREEKFLNQLSEVILKSCTSLVSLKSNKSCNSKNTTLGRKTNENAASNSSMILTLVDDRHEEQINPLPEEHSTMETEGKTIFQKSENNMSHKRRLFWGPGCALSEKRRKKRDNLANSDLSKDSLQMQSDEILEAATETVISADTILTESTSGSGNIIECTPAKSLSPIVCKSKNTLAVNLSNLSSRKQSIVIQKSITENGVLEIKQGTDSDVTLQNLVSDPTGNNLLENSALSLVQETCNERTNERNAAADSLISINQQNMKAIADIVETNDILSDGFLGFNVVDLENHAQATNVDENKMMVDNETAATVIQNEELTPVQHRELENTGTLRAGATAASSRNEVFQNECTDLLIESQKIVPSQTTNNDESTKPPRKLNSDCRATKSKKHLKVSATELLMVERESSSVTTPDTSEVNIAKEQDTPLEITESSHDSCAAISPTPSFKAISQELDHQSPIEYLSLDPYSSEQESEGKQSPNKTACWREETALEKQNSEDLLVDLFNPVTSATNPSARTLTSAEAPGDSTILSLDTFSNKEEALLASK